MPPHSPRRRKMVPFEALVQGIARQTSSRWVGTVGATLAEESALVDVDASGGLRVMVRNEAVRRELLAREGAVLDAYNMAAAGRDERRADHLVVWIKPDFVRSRVGPLPATRGGSKAPTPPPAPLDPRAEAQASADVRALAPDLRPDLAASLARMRARLDAQQSVGSQQTDET